MKRFALMFAVVLAIGACKKKAAEHEPEVGPGTGSATATGSGSGSATVKKEPTEAERVAAALKKAEDDAAKENARWTPDLKKRAVELRDGKYKDAKEALTAALASDHRVPGHKDRDAARHPVETLTFFGIAPTMTVVELGAGGGWYTELLAPLLANQGKLVVAGPNAKGPVDKMSMVYGRRLDLFLAKSPELFGKVERVTIEPDAIKLGADGSADLVIAIREMHNWQRRNELDKYLTAIHAVLKDGGTFGLVAHRGKDGTKGEATAESGYLAQDWVIEKVTAKGFELVEKSEINANPKDTKDHEKGVWTLPPNFRLGDKDKDKYAAIGESDRMTLRFKKKAAKK
jgi:predicted methyltransferase